MLTSRKRAFFATLRRTFFVLAMWTLVPSALGRQPTWMLVEMPDFTLLSSASEDETRKWAVEFEQFRKAMSGVIAVNEHLLQPVTMVLFRSDSDMSAYKPLEKGRPAEIAGNFSRGPLGNFIELSAEGWDEEKIEETRHAIFHEGVHWLTSSLKIPLPLWLDEGLAEAFSTFSVSDKSFVIGEPLPWHVLLLREEKMLPLDDLMTVAHGSLLYNEGDRTSIFYAESWELAHYLLFADDSGVHGKLNELVRSLNKSSDPDTAFKRTFGFGCAEMEKKMKDYLFDGRYHSVQIKFDRAAIEQQIKIRPATSTEVEVTLGCLLISVDRDAEAQPALEKAAADAPANPLPLEALSELAASEDDMTMARIYLDRAASKAAGNARMLESLAHHAEIYQFDDEILSFNEQAAAAGSENPKVWFFLGSTYFEQAGVHRDTMISSDVKKIRKAADCFERAIESDADDPRSYQLLGGTMGSLPNVTAEDGKFLQEGVRLIPNDPVVTIGMAIWETKTNEPGKAKLRLDRLREKNAQLNDATRNYLQLAVDLVEESSDEKRLQDDLQEGKLDEAYQILTQLLAKFPSAEKRKQLVALQIKIGERDTLQRARQLVDNHEPDLARALLEDLLSDQDLDPDTRTQAEALKARLK